MEAFIRQRKHSLCGFLLLRIRPFSGFVNVERNCQSRGFLYSHAIHQEWRKTPFFHCIQCRLLQHSWSTYNSLRSNLAVLIDHNSKNHIPLHASSVSNRRIDRLSILDKMLSSIHFRDALRRIIDLSDSNRNKQEQTKLSLEKVHFKPQIHTNRVW